MLYLLLPSFAAVDLMPSTLARWLAQSHRQPVQAPGRDAILRERFHFDAAYIPVAALTREWDAHDAGKDSWLRADPAYVCADMAAARMLACGELGLSQGETQILAASLQSLFHEHGLVLETTTASRWYLRCVSNELLPEFSSPDTVLGDDLYLHMPRDDRGRRWRYLLSEIQISLHHHPLNAERVARGHRPINSLWFWGGGVLPESINTDLSLVISDNDVIRALAAYAKVPSCTLPRHCSEILASLRRDASVLLDLSDLRDGATLERDWFTPLAVGLKNRSITAMQLLFASGERYTVRTGHGWRFWRRFQAWSTIVERS